jgi:hypothetical protein
MIDLVAMGVRSYIAEPDRGRHAWVTARRASAGLSESASIRGACGRRLMRRRGETIERSFAHLYTLSSVSIDAATPPAVKRGHQGFH